MKHVAEAKRRRCEQGDLESSDLRDLGDDRIDTTPRRLFGLARKSRAPNGKYNDKSTIEFREFLRRSAGLGDEVSRTIREDIERSRMSRELNHEMKRRIQIVEGRDFDHGEIGVRREADRERVPTGTRFGTNEDSSAGLFDVLCDRLGPLPQHRPVVPEIKH